MSFVLFLVVRVLSVFQVRRNLNASLFTAPLLHVSEDEGEAPLEDLKMDPPVLGLSDSGEF